ncbi:MAG TPA: hypothetical protein DCM07_31475 [Planctomycetaceae bacterium]|uniref:BON domain-containing protein n=1 Tax=Gimesia sp. TaxID=2024833 RepID=UPI000C6BB41D|nr:hypothetical protein [Gimesia sp.]HAH49284.1 hypothetical protein [Planctomycetaceae bacterium]HBL43453.1 hypothetical protein [Planctomycetaceae bacterium]
MKLQNKPRIPLHSHSDLQLTSQIRRRLQSTGYAGLTSIWIEVHSGEVFLEGTVDSYFLKQMAQVRVLAMSDVRKVYNTIIVSSPGPCPK